MNYTEYTNLTLPKKFQPYLRMDRTMESQLDQGFATKTELSPGVYQVGNLILNGSRPGACEAPNTHLYGLRKAEKIRTFITKNKLESELLAPQKYLYFGSDDKPYVVNEEVELSDDVAKPRSEEVRKLFKLSAPLVGGQLKALAEGDHLERTLSVKQAKALAELTILAGDLDLSYDNLFFTKDGQGQVAILNTEPKNRSLKKRCRADMISYFLLYKGAIKADETIKGMAKLKASCADPLAVKAIEKIEASYVRWSIVKLITKIALVCFIAAFVIPHAVTLVPVALLATALKITLTAALAMKVFVLLISILSIGRQWGLSRKSEAGIHQIAMMQMRGMVPEVDTSFVPSSTVI